MTPKTCVVCGTVYTPRSWSTRCTPVCSKACVLFRREQRRKKVILPCLGCGVDVQLKGRLGLDQARRNRAYCSEACKAVVVSRSRSEAMSRTNRKYASERMRLRNPMAKEEHRKTMSATLRAMAWKPKVRGGNGKTTKPQEMLAAALGWPMEVVVTTGARALGRSDIPNCYKLDVAHEGLKIAVEVDGFSHATPTGRDQDARKTAFLQGLGWTVLRFWNSEVLKDLNACVQAVLSTTSRSSKITTTSQMEFLFITAITRQPMTT